MITRLRSGSNQHLGLVIAPVSMINHLPPVGPITQRMGCYGLQPIQINRYQVVEMRICFPNLVVGSVASSPVYHPTSRPGPLIQSGKSPGERCILLPGTSTSDRTAATLGTYPCIDMAITTRYQSVRLVIPVSNRRRDPLVQAHISCRGVI